MTLLRLLQLFLTAVTVQGWSTRTPPLSRTSPDFTATVTRQTQKRQRFRYLSSSDDDNAESDGARLTSYEEAKDLLERQKLEKELSKSFGDEIAPGSDAESQNALRDAVRARMTELGLEESEKNKQFEAEMAAKAAQQYGPPDSFAWLDLGQITDDVAEGNQAAEEAANGPFSSMMEVEPEELLSEEEQREADPLGFEPWYNQAKTELLATKWPDFPTVVKKCVTVVISGAVSCFLVVEGDNFLREKVYEAGFVPRRQEVLQSIGEEANIANNLLKDTTTDIASPSTISSIPLTTEE